MELFDKNNQWRFTKISELKKKRAELEGEDALIAEMMNWHPEFDEIWPLGEFSSQPREIKGQMVNPFIHTALHVIVEQQIAQELPLEISKSFKKLLSQGKDRHTASHQICTIYARHYFDSFRQGQPFDEATYILDVENFAGPPEGPDE